MKIPKVETIIGALWLMALISSIILAAVGMVQIAKVINVISWITLTVFIGVQIYNRKD